MTLNWRNFKTDPPYDAQSDLEAGCETDHEYAWFIYRFISRPKGPENQRLSHKSCKFSNGVFEGYENTSSDLEYHKEILAWVSEEEVKKLIEQNFIVERQARINACLNWE